jgi:DNA polymerase-1
VSTKSVDHQNAVLEVDLPGPEAADSTVSTVSPHCTTYEKQPELNTKQLQWVKSVETVDPLTLAAADPEAARWRAEHGIPEPVLLPPTTLREQLDLARLASKAEPAPPAEPLVVAGSTDPLVVDLETASADELWRTPDPARPFVRLVGTDHGIGTDPAELLEHQGPLVAHNGFGFDFLALAHHHGLDLLGLSEAGRLIDTMVLEALAHPNREDLKPEQYIRQLGLDAAAERRGLLGKTDDLVALAIAAAKAAGLKGTPTELKAAGFELIPQGDPKYTGYLRGDVVAGRAVFDAQCPGGQLTPYQRRELRLMGRLTHGITLMGFRIDRQEIEAREAARQQRIAGTVARLEAIGLPPRTQDKKGKWNTPHATAAGKAAIAAAFAELGIVLPATATGQPQIKADALLAIAAEHHDNPSLVGLAEDVAGLVGSRSTYGNVLGYAAGDRVHPAVFPGQATGRCSITKPGLTVFGKHGGKVAEREVFLPDADDHLLLAIDLSKADARAVAVWSQDPGYLDLFDAGVDINQALAEQFGIPKTLAKALGHGTRYNQQPRGMHNQTGIPLPECEAFIDRHRQQHAAVHRWIDRVVAIGKSGRPLQNGFGRLLYTGRHTKGDRQGESKAFTQAPAYMGQSTTREWMAEGILRLPLEIAAQVRCFLHDEVVLSVPEGHLDLYREALLEAFQFSWAPPPEAMVIPGSGAVRPVPVVAELSAAGRTWADCYRGES